MNEFTKTKWDGSVSGYNKAIFIYTTNMQTQKYFFSKKEKGDKEQKASQWKIRENAFNSLKRRGVIQTSERTNFLRHHPKDRF